jgi:FtsP/CotA-like multicopper oxidase with cupredoxin domain
MCTNRSGSDRERRTAARNRRELVSAALSRRALLKLGLLTSGGYLVAKNGLSARASGGNPQSPPTRPFIEPMPIMPVKQPVPALSPAPTVAPNTAAGEARTRSHQALARFPPRKLYEVRQRAALVSMSPDLPLQETWGYDGITPGPTYVARYGEPILVRSFNDLPADNGGFGLNEVSVHQHNGHTPSESDGFPCDFARPGQFYDHHYPNLLAGFDSTHPPFGDPNEALSTLWYHDHRADFTAQNVYKGLAGTYLLFNDKDTGDETTGFRLPSGEFDVPLFVSDKVFDEDGRLFFDLFNLDGVLGDKFVVNGKIQPFFQVHPRRYRFRVLDAGPSRFYKFFLTDLNSPATTLPFWQISNDGNLLPKPIQVTSVLLKRGGARRYHHRFLPVGRPIDRAREPPGTGRWPRSQRNCRASRAGRLRPAVRCGAAGGARQQPAPGGDNEVLRFAGARAPAGQARVPLRAWQRAVADQRPVLRLQPGPLPGAEKQRRDLGAAEQFRRLAAPHPRSFRGIPDPLAQRPACAGDRTVPQGCRAPRLQRRNRDLHALSRFRRPLSAALPQHRPRRSRDDAAI